MRYRNVTHLALVLYTTISFILFAVFFFIVCLLCGARWQFSAMISLFLSSFISFMNFILYRNAFCWFEMNDEGIKNKYKSVRWEEIDQIEVCETRVGSFPRFKSTRVACVGDVPQVKSNFFAGTEIVLLDSRKCICFSVSKRNVRAMQKYAVGKSRAIDEFLKRYE